MTIVLIMILLARLHQFTWNSNFIKANILFNFRFLQIHKNRLLRMFLYKCDNRNFAPRNYMLSLKSAILNSTFGKLRFPIELFRNL